MGELNGFGEHLKKMMPVFGLEKTYSREEVISLISKREHAIACDDYFDEEKWLEENLPK